MLCDAPPEAPAGSVPFEVYAAACDFAREFNEYVEPDRVFSAASAPSEAKGDRPGDDFNRRASWAEVLEPHGWKVCRTSGPVTYWTRPGKDVRHGCSATTGKCSSDLGGDLLYVFTSNALPFDAEAAYDKFGALTRLEFGGDFKAATVAVVSRGYGETRTAPPIVFPEPEAAPSEADDVAGIEDLRNAGASVKWVWEGWIQRGVCTAIAAQGGTGKTRLTADLVRRVRHGLTWPDGTPTGGWDSKTVALWVVADNHHDEMVSLSESFGIVDCIKVNAGRADPYAGVTLESVEEFAALEKRVKAVRPLFVVVDTVGNSTDRNLSRQEDAKAFYQPLQIIARRQGVAVLCLTHLNAGGKVLGRRALEKVRTCIRMNAADNDPAAKRRLEVIKTNSPKPPALGVLMGGDGNTYDDQPPAAPDDETGIPQPKISPKQLECNQWLEERIKITAVKVSETRKACEKAGFTADNLYKAKAALKLEEVEVEGYKWWRLPIQD